MTPKEKKKKKKNREKITGDKRNYIRRTIITYILSFNH
jgi:hypothetical protein